MTDQHPPTTAEDPTAVLRSEIASLRAQLASVTTQVERLLRSGVGTDGALPDPSDGSPPATALRGADPAAHGTDDQHGRRQLLGRIGAAAGAAVAGVAAATAFAPPAGAADGDALLLGVNTNTASSSTVVEYVGAQQIHGVVVGDNTGAATLDHGSAALVGKANYLDNGVLALSEVEQTNALRAVATGGNSAAVRATATAAGSVGVVARGSLAAVHAEQPIQQANVWGVLVTGGRRGLRTDGTTTFPLSLAPFQGSPGLSPLPAFVGDWFVDDTGDVWCCVADGTPGTYRRVTGPGTSGAFTAVEPRRVADTRFAGGPIAHGQQRTIGVANAINPFTGAVSVTDFVPAGATAIAYNVTVTNTVGAGYVQVAPGDATSVTSSSVNWTGAGQTVANGLVVKLDVNRAVKVFAAGTGSSADVIIDVLGYHR